MRRPILDGRGMNNWEPPELYDSYDECLLLGALIEGFPVNVPTEAFYLEDHRILFEMIRRMTSCEAPNGKPPDIVELCKELKRCGKLNYIGGPGAVLKALIHSPDPWPRGEYSFPVEDDLATVTRRVLANLERRRTLELASRMARVAHVDADFSADEIARLRMIECEAPRDAA